MCEFYAFRLTQRCDGCDDTVELPHAAGRLFQQYLVDAYAKVESERLSWVMRNQGALRVDSLRGLMDYLHTMPTEEGSESQTAAAGSPVILPATFGGSPRALHQLYLDAVALVSRFGRPDFFITMTANPQWPEVQKNLGPGQTAANRPDLVARCFFAKLQHFLCLLTRRRY